MPDTDPAIPLKPPGPTPLAPVVQIPTWMKVSFVLAMVAMLGLGGFNMVMVARKLDEIHSVVPPKPAYDPAFAEIGEAYAAKLPTSLASAWDDGAAMLEVGQPFESSLSYVTNAWNSARKDTFDQLVTPGFARILPEGARAADMTPAQRVAMAKAWRGLARGLRGEK